jgi:hypothetical protein
MQESEHPHPPNRSHPENQNEYHAPDSLRNGPFAPALEHGDDSNEEDENCAVRENL